MSTDLTKPVHAPCTTWGERLGGMLDPGVPATDAAAFIAHLPTCPGCRIAFDHLIRCERVLLTRATLADPRGVPERRASTASTRRVTQRRTRPRRAQAWPWLVGAAALLAIGVVIAVQDQRGATGDAFAAVESASNLSDADGHALVSGARLVSGSSLRGGPAEIRLRDGTRLWLDAESRMVLSSGATLRSGGRSGVLVRLDEGAVGVSAKPQDASTPLAVQTPLAETVVVGTAFRVAHSSSGSELTVSSGTVRLISKEGERLVQAGGQARVDVAPPPATLLASFSASAVVGTTEPGKPLNGWTGTGSLRALPPNGLEQPILRDLGKGHGLCFNGVNQRLATAIPAFDARQGVTLIALFIPINPGRDQRVVALLDGTHERVALVRHDLEPGVISAVVDGSERQRLDVPKGKYWSIACRIFPDGGIVLNSSKGSGRRANVSMPGPFVQPQLVFGGSSQGRALEGDIIAVELHAGVLDDDATAARVRALADANRFPLTSW
jgi:ferric-dicitrate binding protein FerR (iron transport regulator)